MKDAGLEVYLVVPALWYRFEDLAAAEQCRGIRAAGLEQLCSCAKKPQKLSDDQVRGGVEMLLAQIFFQAVQSPALAKIALAGETGQAQSGYWLRADPVQLVADRDQLLLAGQTQLVVTALEARQIADDLNRFYHDIAWKFTVYDGLRWYLQMPNTPKIQTSSLSYATGRPIDTLLPQGEDARELHARLNELQMFLHQHSVNAERETRGLAPINSLWFWGEGDSVPAPAHSWQSVRSSGDDVFMRGLGIYGGCPFHADNDANAFIEHAPAGRHLVYLPECWHAWHTGEVEVWRAALQQLDKNWFMPLAKAVSKRVSRVYVISENQLCKCERRPGVWGWRAGRTLSKLFP